MNPSTVYCDACGAANRSQARFCTNCGQATKQQASPLPPQFAANPSLAQRPPFVSVPVLAT